MVLWAGILLDFRKNYHIDDGAKRFHRSSFVHRHSSFYLSRLMRVCEEKWEQYLRVMVTDPPAK